MDLLTLSLLCGPWVDPEITLRVILVESGGHPYVLHDNTLNQSIEAGSAAEAAAIATLLLASHHRLDIGLMQINVDAWLKPARVAIEVAFDPCTNIRIGTIILSANYAQALRASPDPDAVLANALTLYHSGRMTGSPDYAETVLHSNPGRLLAAHPTARSAQTANVTVPMERPRIDAR